MSLTAADPAVVKPVHDLLHIVNIQTSLNEVLFSLTSVRKSSHSFSVKVFGSVAGIVRRFSFRRLPFDGMASVFSLS